MGNQHQGDCMKNTTQSLCDDAECTVKKDSSTLDRSEHPFVAALLQQEN